MTKIKIISLLGFLSILGLSFVLTTPLLAEISTSTTSTVTSTPSTTLSINSHSANSHPMPLIVEIDPAGNVLMRGTVSSINTDSLTLKTWGGICTVKVYSNTKFTPEGLTLDQVKNGEFIGLKGKVNSEENLTVNATLIHDWTEKKIVKKEIKQNKKEVKEIIKETPKPAIHILIIESIDTTNNVLTGKLNDQTITVKLVNTTKLIDRNWKTINFNQLKTNDTIRVYGILSDNSLEASVIRDISIPRK
jgi:hypothetical protein